MAEEATGATGAERVEVEREEVVAAVVAVEDKFRFQRTAAEGETAASVELAEEKAAEGMGADLEVDSEEAGLAAKAAGWAAAAAMVGVGASAAGAEPPYTSPCKTLQSLGRTTLHDRTS